MKTIDELLKEIEAGLQQFGVCPKCGLNVEVRHRYGCEVAERDSVADAKALIAIIKRCREQRDKYIVHFWDDARVNQEERRQGMKESFEGNDAELLKLAEE